MKINGTPVVDAKKKVVIHVKPTDVARGDTKDPAACAAALACVREIMGVAQARVHISRTYLKIDKKWVRYATPQSLRAEIIAFDRGGAFAPGEYVLGPCNPAAKLTGKRTGSRVPDKPRIARISRPRKYHAVADVRSHGANR